MLGEIYEHAVRSILAVGILIGLGIAGLIALLIWLWNHVSIGWLP